MISLDTIPFAISAVQSVPPESLSDKVKDDYKVLLIDLNNKIEGDEAAQYALKKLQDRPDSKAWREILSEELVRLNLDEDGELNKLARGVLENLRVEGGPTIIQGDVYSGGSVITTSGHKSQTVIISGSPSYLAGDDVKVDSGGDKDDNK